MEIIFQVSGGERENIDQTQRIFKKKNCFFESEQKNGFPIYWVSNGLGSYWTFTYLQPKANVW